MTAKIDLEDACVLVTGASRGIGRAIALAAAPHRPHLILVARTSADLNRVGEQAGRLGARVDALAVDVADDGALDEIVRATPNRGLAGLVHSAGVCPLGTVRDTTAADLDLSWQINLRVPYLLTSRLLPALLRARGHVLFINSGAGKVAKAGWSAYAASKHGLRALADALRDEVAERGVRVTSVYPGRTATDMQAAVHAHEGKTYEPERFIRPEDVASLALGALLTAPPSCVEEISIRPTP